MKQRYGWVSDDGKFSSFASEEVEDYEKRIVKARLMAEWQDSQYGLTQFLDSNRALVAEYIERNDPF